MLEGDHAIVSEAEKSLTKLQMEVAEQELETLLSGEADGNDSYLQINAGAGGTESQDWASMLMRMYTRWANQNKFKVSILDEHAGEEAGIKSCTLEIKGHKLWKVENRTGVMVWSESRPMIERQGIIFASSCLSGIDDNIDIQINGAMQDRHLPRLGCRRPACQYN